MGHRIEVETKGSVDYDSSGLISKSPIKVYNIDDNSLVKEELSAIEKLLSDPEVDTVSTDKPSWLSLPKDGTVVEMSPKPGVNDPEGEVVKKAIERTLGRDIGEVSLARQFLWTGELGSEDYTHLQKKLGNPLINEFRKVGSDSWDSEKGMGFHFPHVDLPKVPAFEYSRMPIDTENPHPEEGKLLMELSDDGLKVCNERSLWALSSDEMKTIVAHFKDSEVAKRRAEVGLKAMPTDAEIENLAQTWSEHCIHKKFKAKWVYTSDDPNDESGLDLVNDGLFPIIQKPAYELSKKFTWVVSAFEDNAGVIAFNESYTLAHKVETHNHPTTLDSHGGANTGTGGVLRDNKSTGKNQRLVSSQWNFRVPHPKALDDLPNTIQTSSRTLEGMVSGVEDYGNKMGVPTMCGDVMIDDGWLKCGCYVGGVSVAKKEVNGRPTHLKDIRPGYIALTLGGKVGKDGMKGATGSSLAHEVGDEKREDVNQSVQIGAPITEKGVFEVMNTLQELDLIEAAQDCGAGGWNSAVGELTGLLNKLEKARYKIQQTFREEGITLQTSYDQRIAAAPDVGLDKVASPFADQLKFDIRNGAIFDFETNGKGGSVMDLTNVPEKYKGLAGWEKEISEAQEREVLVIKPENLERVLEICEHNNVDAMKIVDFNDTGDYTVLDQDQIINYLPIDFMDQGLPRMTINAHWKPCENEEPQIEMPEDLTEMVLKLMAAPNMQSYDWIMTRFDHEVQGGSLVKPLVGIGKAKSDAIAYRPILDEKGVVIEVSGSNPWQGDIDTYHMGRNNVVDAIGKIIAVGGSLSDEEHKIAFNGNTTCPKPESDSLVAAKVIRMIKGASDAQLAFDAPTISGKDSTSMEKSYVSTKTGEEVHLKAKPELLMKAISVIPDDSTLTTCDFKLPGDLIYVVGETWNELGGSEFYLMHGETGRNVPESDFDEIRPRYERMSSAIKKELVHSAQYISKGGLVAALSNSAMGGDLGFKVDMDLMQYNVSVDEALFSETTGRFVVTVHPSQREKFEEEMDGVYISELGVVRTDKEVCVRYDDKNVVSTDVDDIREANKGEIRL